MPRSNLYRALLKLEQFVFETARQAELTQTRARLSTEVVGDIEIYVVRENWLFTSPARVDELREIGRDIQCPTVVPSVLKPLRQSLRCMMVEHIDVQLPLLCQSLKG